MNRKRITIFTAVAAAAALTISGCSFDKMTEPFQDAPRTGQVNNSAAQVITMPDGFSNLASKCDGPNRVYVAYHGDRPYASLFVVANDPRRKG
jgi:hypothetical protein